MFSVLNIEFAFLSALIIKSAYFSVLIMFDVSHMLHIITEFGSYIMMTEKRSYIMMTEKRSYIMMTEKRSYIEYVQKTEINSELNSDLRNKLRQETRLTRR